MVITQGSAKEEDLTSRERSLVSARLTSSGIPHFFTIGCVVFRILSGVRLKIIIFTSSGGAPLNTESNTTYQLLYPSEPLSAL